MDGGKIRTAYPSSDPRSITVVEEERAEVASTATVVLHMTGGKERLRGSVDVMHDGMNFHG